MRHELECQLALAEMLEGREMNGYYKGKIKVVRVDMLCFAADLETLEPLDCGTYDPYAWIDPESEPVETIDVCEWNRRINERREAEYKRKIEEEFNEQITTENSSRDSC